MGKRMALCDQEAGRTLLIVRIEDDEPIGRIEFEAGSPANGWLTVRDIVVAPECRGFGYGGEAIRLLEADATRSGRADRFRADVPVANGLALYVWLRLGYRPADEDTAPPDTLVMVRTPDA